MCLFLCFQGNQHRYKNTSAKLYVPGSAKLCAVSAKLYAHSAKLYEILQSHIQILDVFGVGLDKSFTG